MLRRTRLTTPSLLAGLLAATLSVGCGGSTETAPAETAEEPDVPLAQSTTVEGCLRGGSSAGTYVLAALPTELGASADRMARGQVATYTYELVGGENLDQYVGRAVRVTGVVEDDDEVEIDREEEVEGEPTRVDGKEVTPTVEIEEEAVIEVRRLRVSSVLGTSGSCEQS